MELVETNTVAAEIDRLFALQQASYMETGAQTVRQRIGRLRRFEQVLMAHQREIEEAVYNDFRKPRVESAMVELYVVLNDIRFACRNLARWARPRNVGVPPLFIGGSTHVVYEPKGVVLVIAPWNYPFMLALNPVVSAIAAGNTVILKPSEAVPHTAAVVEKVVRAAFDEKEVAVVQGGPEVGQLLLEKPFNHVFFTGSARIGKLIKASAAKNLASVTLELGGKSPVIVDETANIPDAAFHIAWGKFTNAGQTCVAPDFVWVHESVRDRLVEGIQKEATRFFGENPQVSPDYTRMVHVHHFRKVKQMLEEAVHKGGRVIWGGKFDEEDRYIAPTILDQVPLHTTLMGEEIFGPVLPILTFKDLSEPIAFARGADRPLVNYIFSRRKRNIRRIVRETRAGGTSINLTMAQFYNDHMPFGGSNQSGIGKSHGFYGFETFSNLRGVYHQKWPSLVYLVRPPYTRFREWVAEILIRWL